MSQSYCFGFRSLGLIGFRVLAFRGLGVSGLGFRNLGLIGFRV